MASQKGQEGTCDCHPGQESLQTPKEQPSSSCVATGNALAAFAHLVAHGLCSEHRAPRQNSSQGRKRAGKAGREGLAECYQEAKWDADCKLPTKLEKVVHTHLVSCSWVLSAVGATGVLH